MRPTYVLRILTKTEAITEKQLGVNLVTFSSPHTCQVSLAQLALRLLTVRNMTTATIVAATSTSMEGFIRTEKVLGR